jgi:antitoxin VapB
MSLNIKNPRTHALVRELAAATGSTQTAAVEDAVRRRLDEVRRPTPDEEAEEKREAIQRVVREFQAGLTDAQRDDIRAWQRDMYGPDGLPR